MFTRLLQHRREQWRRRDCLLWRSWNELTQRAPGDGRVIAFFGSSNLFWPHSMDRQLSEMLRRGGARDIVLNLGSFGFGDSSFIASTLLALRENYRQRHVDLVICEITPNEMPALEPEETRGLLSARSRGCSVLDYADAMPVVDRLRNVQLPLLTNLQRIARIARQGSPSCPVLVLDYESNLREWSPTVSYFSRPLTERDATAFRGLLRSAIDFVRGGLPDRALEYLRRCDAIDPHVAITAYLEAKLSDAEGDVTRAEPLYRRARDLDLLRGRLSRERLMPELREWCDGLGLWFVPVPAIVKSLSPAGIPGFDVFVDEAHYRPHVHFAIAAAIVNRLAEEGWCEASARAVDRDGVLSAVEGQPLFLLLQGALNLVMVPASPFNDERIAEGVRQLDEAERRGVDRALLDEYRLRFRILAGDENAAPVALQSSDKRPIDPLALALGFASQSAPSAARRLSADEIAPRLSALLLARFGLQMESKAEDTDLLSLGVDSLGLSELVLALEQLFDVRLDDRMFERQVSFAMLRDLIAVRLRDPQTRRHMYARSVARRRALERRQPRQLEDLHTEPASIGVDMAQWGRQSVAEVIERHIREQASRRAVTLLPSGSRRGDQCIDWTWGDLGRASSDAAQWLGSVGVSRGKVVHFLTGHGTASVSGIVGALRLGAVPSIGHAPSPKLLPEIFAETFAELVRRSTPAVVIVPPDLEPLVVTCLASIGAAERPRVVSTESFAPASNTLDAGESVSPASTATSGLLQHSSGTTGARKGVMLAHGAIMHQAFHYADAIDLRRDDHIVSWLPLYHDMGLVACFLVPLLTATPVTLMSPFDWVSAPHVLFELITRDRGTLVWLPNFAFHFLVERVQPEQLQDVDLSSVRAFINCSEPIDVESWQRFYDRFGFYGLSRLAYGTCYAMAENVFAVTQGGIREPVYVDFVDAESLRRERRAVNCDPGREDERRIVAVPSSGTPIGGSRVRVVSQDRTRAVLADRVVGEIEIASGSLARGYYNNDGATADRFRNGWYRTGDLGYLVGRQLFVLGRDSDVIVAAGTNLFADDIEQVVTRVPGVKPGRVAAFGVRHEHMGTERVVVLFERAGGRASDDDRSLRNAVQQRLQDSQIATSDVYIVPRGTVRKTSSGKVARRTMKQLFESGAFQCGPLSPTRRRPEGVHGARGPGSGNDSIETIREVDQL